MELMLGVRVLPVGFPPRLPLEHVAIAGLKRWELVIVIWGLGMPTATNGPAATDCQQRPTACNGKENKPGCGDILVAPCHPIPAGRRQGQ